MKNPLFTEFESIEEQRDAFAVYITEMMKPGVNDKVIIEELQLQNNAMMDECDVLQAKFDSLSAVNEELQTERDKYQLELMQKREEVEYLKRMIDEDMHKHRKEMKKFVSFFKRFRS